MQHIFHTVCINCKYSKHSNLQTSFSISECSLTSHNNPVQPTLFPQFYLSISHFSAFVIKRIIHVYIWITDYCRNNTKAASVELEQSTEDIMQWFIQMWLHGRLYSLLSTELFISNNFKSVIVCLFPNQRNVYKSVHIIYLWSRKWLPKNI